MLNNQQGIHLGKIYFPILNLEENYFQQIIVLLSQEEI